MELFAYFSILIPKYIMQSTFVFTFVVRTFLDLNPCLHLLILFYLIFKVRYVD